MEGREGAVCLFGEIACQGGGQEMKKSQDGRMPVGHRRGPVWLELNGYPGL